jgi:hypothetical protein
MIKLLLVTRQQQVVRQQRQRDLLEMMRKKLQEDITELEITAGEASGGNTQAANSSARNLGIRRQHLQELDEVLKWVHEVQHETKEAIRRMELGIRTCDLREVVNKKRGVKNSFKPSTAKKQEEAMFLSTNLHMQQLWVTSENLMPRGARPKPAPVGGAVAAGGGGADAGGGDDFVPLVGIGVDAGNTFEQDSFMGGSGHRPKVVYDNVTVGCPSAHALGFKDMGFQGGVEQLQKESMKMKEKKQQQAMEAKKPQSIHQTQGSFELFGTSECSLLEVVGFKCNQYRLPAATATSSANASTNASTNASAKPAETAGGASDGGARGAGGADVASTSPSVPLAALTEDDAPENVYATGHNAQTLGALDTSGASKVSNT